MDNQFTQLENKEDDNAHANTHDQLRPGAHFASETAITHYTDGPPRMVPGLAGMHRMSAILLAERAPLDARVLVLGAGGGMELKVFAEAQPEWEFDGVDPSAAMLRLAETTLGPLMARIRLHEGYMESGPTGPFDGAVCLLTFHFLPVEERLRTLREMHCRLRPGAPLVVAHFSFPQREPERSLWLSRYAAFATASGIDRDNALAASTGIGARLPILAPEHDEALLREAGFSDVTLFYVGFTFRGWVAYA